MKAADSTDKGRTPSGDAKRARLVLPEQAQCLGCGYLLRELPKCRCPECGRPFLPNDPRSYIDASRVGVKHRLSSALRRNFLLPIDWSYFSFNALLAVVVIALSSILSGIWILTYQQPNCCFAPGLPAIVVISLAYEVFRGIGRAQLLRTTLSDSERSSARSGTVRRSVLCALLIIALGTYCYPWPLALRLAACAQEIERAVIADIRGGPGLSWRSVGSFSVRRVRLGDSPSSVSIEIDDCLYDFVRTSEVYDLSGTECRLPYDPTHGSRGARRWLFGPWYVE